MSTASYHLDDTISTICNKNNMNKENGKDTVRWHMPSRPGNNVTCLINFFLHQLKKVANRMESLDGS